MLTLHPSHHSHPETRQYASIPEVRLHRISTILLASIVSVVAAVVAVVLRANTDIADPLLVVGTATVAFASSWINSNLPERQ